MAGTTRTIHLPSTRPTTPALWLTETRLTDADSIFNILTCPNSGPKIYRLTGTIPNPYSLENAHTFLQTMADRHAANERVTTFAVRLDGETSPLVGVVGLRTVVLDLQGEGGAISRAVAEGVLTREIDGGKAVEIGYWIDGDLEGKGIGTRIATEAVRIAREEMNMQVVGCCFEENAASARVLAKSGLEYRGMVQGVKVRPEWGPRNLRVFMG
ncbi:hypothetical protein HDU87_004932 [Geranomyces variabilis]|uniref:N-acetyltransferase domain-containing protein n=1 Tax=Geranomyces variabilis TaxID=109894 RepID=A0AAD5THH8_9FUNG|nr:hypothetical protein HDU87_004932 [Geranomyces variabilis]